MPNQVAKMEDRATRDLATLRLFRALRTAPSGPPRSTLTCVSCGTLYDVPVEHARLVTSDPVWRQRCGHCRTDAMEVEEHVRDWWQRSQARLASVDRSRCLPLLDVRARRTRDGWTVVVDVPTYGEHWITARGLLRSCRAIHTMSATDWMDWDDVPTVERLDDTRGLR